MSQAFKKKRKEHKEFHKQEAETLEKLSNQLRIIIESKIDYGRNESNAISDGSASNGRGNDQIIFASKSQDTNTRVSKQTRGERRKSHFLF